MMEMNSTNLQVKFNKSLNCILTSGYAGIVVFYFTKLYYCIRKMSLNDKLYSIFLMIGFSIIIIRGVLMSFMDIKSEEWFTIIGYIFVFSSYILLLYSVFKVTFENFFDSCNYLLYKFILAACPCFLFVREFISVLEIILNLDNEQKALKKIFKILKYISHGLLLLCLLLTWIFIKINLRDNNSQLPINSRILIKRFIICMTTAFILYSVFSYLKIIKIEQETEKFVIQ